MKTVSINDNDEIWSQWKSIIEMSIIISNQWWYDETDEMKMTDILMTSQWPVCVASLNPVTIPIQWPSIGIDYWPSKWNENKLMKSNNYNEK